METRTQLETVKITSNIFAVDSTYNANGITFDNNIQPITSLIPLHITWQRIFFCLPMANYIVHLPLPLEKTDKKSNLVIDYM